LGGSALLGVEHHPTPPFGDTADGVAADSGALSTVDSPNGARVDTALVFLDRE